MRIIRMSAMLGPNVWSRAPVLEIEFEPMPPLHAASGASACLRFGKRAQELQTLAGTPVSQFWVEGAVVVLEFIEESVARLAAKFAHEIVWGAADDLPDPMRSIERLRECAKAACFGATTGPVVE